MSRDAAAAALHDPANAEFVAAFRQKYDGRYPSVYAAMAYDTLMAMDADADRRLTGAEVKFLPNPRKEADENDLLVKNDQFLALGLNPITLQEGLLAEVVDVARKYAHRIDRSRGPAVSAWTKDIAQRVDHDPEGRKLRAV